jgi:hypothetical protein
VADQWKFRLLSVEVRSRRLIVEGHALPPYERTYYDPLFFYGVVGPDYLSLEMSRDFDGDRLLLYLTEFLGPPDDGPRVQVGGSQLDEEGALMLVEWRFAPEQRGALLRRLEEILGQPLVA